ncbi:unnamed protein product [Phytomonas sp. Hart1]|nr:unnamed protein product [Phytomonas sp. Hart1]|eukprot:CCW69339.1 unnamed protein product [Phytomonas sp. isolate Hart1]
MSAVPVSASRVFISAEKSSMYRWFVQPAVNAFHYIERRSQRRLAMLEPETMKYVQAHEADGTDAAKALTSFHIQQQRHLLHYRVLRFCTEFRYLFSMQYFKNYNVKDFVWDARFLTRALFLFIVGVIVGRQSVFPLIEPDSPFVQGLTHKIIPSY